MKKIYKNRIAAGIFFSFVAFSFSIYGCAAGKPASVTTPIKIKGEKEILVARDIGGGLPFSLIRWCGNNALLIYGGEFGTQWVDIKGNKATISTNSADYPVDCTPDGKWVLYADRNSAREYRDKEGRTPENIVDEGPGWHGSVMDLYRYEIKTGTRQKFAVVRDDSSALISPDGSKVLFGNRHDWDIEMPEPRWEPMWLTNEWTYFNARWLSDSSGVVTLVWNANASLGVEIFGKNGWAKEFSLDMIRSDPRANVSLEAADKNNVLHFTTVEDYPASNLSRRIYNFFSCKIKQKDLICGLREGIEEEEGDNILSITLLPNEDVIFKKEEDNCVRRVKRRKTVAECIADTRYGDVVYLDIDLIEISPDGRWMAFRRGKLPPQGNRFYAYQYDLFVIEVGND
ncbi:MAG: hypothetical protein AABZ23_03720 [Deltaproteobacteria bacterium]